MESGKNWQLLIFFSSTLLWIFFSISSIAQSGRDGQNNTCETAYPFCTGTQYAFPAGINAGTGQTGPDYNCLINTPNPAWYYLKVADPGNIIIEMHSDPERDIDFCVWGPFNYLNCCNQLTYDKVVDCDYSDNLSKTCTIPSGLTGQYYMFVITNISNLPCNIIFTQIGGTGTTDCNILPPPCSNNGPICVGQILQLNASTVLSATYHWSGPDGFSSNSQNPSIENVQLVNAGDYYLHLFINGQPENDSSKTTVNIYDPIADAGNDTIIQNGVYITLHGSAAQGCGSYQYHWEPADLLIDPDVASPITVNLFSTTLFTLTVTDDSASCQSQDMMTVNIIGGGLAVNAIAIPSTICAGQTSQLQSFGSGGTGYYTFSWTGPDNFSSNLQNPSVQPLITSTYTVTISDGYNTSANTVTINVNQLPIADPGEDKSIPHGTYTFLDGSVTGGTSNYFYSWSPADKLVNPNVQFPQTVNLTETTVYSLEVTDLVTNCISDNQAYVSISVTGGPLNVNPTATPDWICRGDTTRLHASAGGGNVGYYQYEWSSVPPGFSSSEAEPYVSPEVNTIYSVTVFDGYNSIIGTTGVYIYPEPLIHLGPPDSTICIYDTLKLDAGNEGSEYLWSNGATTRIISIQAAGIVPETQNYSVKVTNEYGCSTTSSISIIYSYSACTGVNEPGEITHFLIYPNPSTGISTFIAPELPEDMMASITNIHGKLIRTFLLRKSESGSIMGTLDLSVYPKGLYFVRFWSKSQLWNEKLVIQ